MKSKIAFIVAVGFAIFSCSKGRNADSSDEIPGAYAKEYSFKVVNQDTGDEIGMRTIRDTIFIRYVETDYEITNRKWRLNDYDIEGWQSMEHDEDSPTPTFIGRFNSADSTMIFESRPVLHFDLRNSILYREKSTISYKKTSEGMNVHKENPKRSIRVTKIKCNFMLENIFEICTIACISMPRGQSGHDRTRTTEQ
jgi:hypothetical protein